MKCATTDTEEINRMKFRFTVQCCMVDLIDCEQRAECFAIDRSLNAIHCCWLLMVVNCNGVSFSFHDRLCPHFAPQRALTRRCTSIGVNETAGSMGGLREREGKQAECRSRAPLSPLHSSISSHTTRLQHTNSAIENTDLASSYTIVYCPSLHCYQ